MDPGIYLEETSGITERTVNNIPGWCSTFLYPVVVNIARRQPCLFSGICPFQHCIEVFDMSILQTQPAVQRRYPPQGRICSHVFSICVADVPEHSKRGQDAICAICFNPLYYGLFYVLSLVDLNPVNGIISIVG